nr:24-hydroxycholesterol 7-alpha-hydroxylase-like isoform X2 [Pelodiscus sinensis]|eukprot:XP_025039191.1 24-hydroxycholesterol 7-alpha-hydroxylase-like isoform X2 [Pelodiscus sinensis]
MDIALAILLTLLLGLLMAKLALFQPRNRNSPPCISGWIPWFGAAFQFGKAPLEFIEQARVKYGPVFTVFALGNRFTFVTEEEGIEAFFTSKDLDFEQAVQPTIQRTTSIPADIFYRNHTRLYLTIKGKVSLSRLYLFAGTLCKELHEHMDHLGTSGTENLSDLISNWSKSKKWLLKMFENVVSDAERVSRPESDSKTVLQHLLDNVHGKHLAPNYALLLLWASQANAMPVAFWTLAFILSHPSIYKNIMEDIVSVFGKAGKENIEVSEDDLKKLLLIKWCILEAIRLRSPGAITKKVVNPLKIQTFTIPAGDMLMVSPYWAHRNTKYFPDPETFKPDRWKEANLEKNAFLDGFMAFGRGKHQCPGRWLAVMEVHMLVVLLLYKYELILLDPVPKESPLHLVGTQQPMGACRVQYKPRQ